MIASVLIATLLFAPMSNLTDSSPSTPRLRFLDRGLAVLIAEARALSPTLEQLVVELEASDVIVHVLASVPDPSASAAALQFVTCSGGFRFVRIRIASGLDPVTTLKLIGHELQHALEIARDRSIVDEPTFEAFYRRIGFPVRPGRTRASYETHGARAVERQVVQELQNSAATTVLPGAPGQHTGLRLRQR